MPLPVTPALIAAAHERIAGRVRTTPLFEADGLGLSHRVQLKLEFLQHAGTFKPRGAFNSLLSGNVPKAGVAAAQFGDHHIEGSKQAPSFCSIKISFDGNFPVYICRCIS